MPKTVGSCVVSLDRYFLKLTESSLISLSYALVSKFEVSLGSNTPQVSLDTETSILGIRMNGFEQSDGRPDDSRCATTRLLTLR